MMLDRRVRKAVFPVAGMGTRFLPATKALPKEMLPIVDKPLIQYAVEEAIAAGITDLIFVTSHAKRAIEDHFDSNHELECKLHEQGRHELLALVHDILPKGVSCAYVRQHEALGLGHAVLCAKHIVGNEPFAVLLADDLIDNADDVPCMKQMVGHFNKTNCSVIAVQDIPLEHTHKYGVVDIKDEWSGFGTINGIVEKPKPEVAPSTLAAVGRYVLSPRIFERLEQVRLGAGGEIQLTDAIAALVQDEYVYAYQFNGVRYDCGSKLGYLKASLAYALRHPEIGEGVAAHLQQLAATLEHKIHA